MFQNKGSSVTKTLNHPLEHGSGSEVPVGVWVNVLNPRDAQLASTYVGCGINVSWMEDFPTTHVSRYVTSAE
eukprot:CAMPEP_0194490276 /NCGR_PEP_ID=MMETSP0253-20130528/9551_1 /TAXON_ID=2966 /ORGANISM="Noctiluca scintillans" /LENGTH=71 /DNA_ID=CAMNT_0039330885 /DNA_START=141 /DNA_END=356 /DNA_ORIENTATION=-